MKKTETKTVTEYYFDLCGKEVDGIYYLAGPVNNDSTVDYICPLDLCKAHMKLFADFIYFYKGNPLRLLNEHYEESSLSYQELLKEFKAYIEEAESN